jgi:anti-sigma factor RsiW
MSPTPVTEDDLHALVDGQLPAARASEVTEWLSQHPAEAARVLAWQGQRAQLRALHCEVLDEPVPQALLDTLRPPRAFGWRQGLAAGALLGLGLALGWSGHGVVNGRMAAQAAIVPGFVKEAAMAHVVYTPEKRHPVEVGANEQAHLVKWLSNRLGGELTLPSLAPQGFHLVGGRLLPGEAGQPRAQFMYENAAGERVTLYVSAVTAPPPEAAATAFRFASNGQGAAATQSFYWVDGRWGYALSAALPRATVATLADALYPQLSRTDASTKTPTNTQP